MGSVGNTALDNTAVSKFRSPTPILANDLNDSFQIQVVNTSLNFPIYWMVGNFRETCLGLLPCFRYGSRIPQRQPNHSQVSNSREMATSSSASLLTTSG